MLNFSNVWDLLIPNMNQFTAPFLYDDLRKVQLKEKEKSTIMFISSAELDTWINECCNCRLTRGRRLLIYFKDCYTIFQDIQLFRIFI